MDAELDRDRKAMISISLEPDILSAEEFQGLRARLLNKQNKSKLARPLSSWPAGQELLALWQQQEASFLQDAQCAPLLADLNKKFHGWEMPSLSVQLDATFATLDPKWLTQMEDINACVTNFVAMSSRRCQRQNEATLLGIIDHISEQVKSLAKQLYMAYESSLQAMLDLTTSKQEARSGDVAGEASSLVVQVEACLDLMARRSAFGRGGQSDPFERIYAFMPFNALKEMGLKHDELDAQLSGLRRALCLQSANFDALAETARVALGGKTMSALTGSDAAKLCQAVASLRMPDETEWSHMSDEDRAVVQARWAPSKKEALQGDAAGFAAIDGAMRRGQALRKFAADKFWTYVTTSVMGFHGRESCRLEQYRTGSLMASMAGADVDLALSRFLIADLNKVVELCEAIEPVWKLLQDGDVIMNHISIPRFEVPKVSVAYYKQSALCTELHSTENIK